MTDIPPQAITDAIDVAVAKIRARVDQEIAEAVAAERERCAQLADRQFFDDPAFERRLRDLMRRNPKLLENWIRQRNRIYGNLSWLRQGGEGGGT